MQEENTKRQRRICKTILLLFSLIVLTLVPFFRYWNFEGWPQEQESYYHMQIAEYLFEEGIPETVPGSVLPMDYSIDPFDIILGIFGKVVGIKNAAILLPVLLGISSIFFVYEVLSIGFPTCKQRVLIAILFCASPVFLTVFSQASDLPWISFLMIVGMWCFLQKGKMQWMSILIFPFLFFYDLFHTLIAMLLLEYVGYQQKERKIVYWLYGIFGIGLLGILLTKNVSFSMSIVGFLELIQILLADVGAPLGMSLFAIILGTIGMEYLWKEKRITWKETGFLILFLGLTLFRSQEYALYLNIAIAILAARGFIHLRNKEWKLHSLQKSVLFLLLLGIIYSGTVTVTELATDFPHPEAIQALQWLEEKSNEQAILLTAPEYGFVTEHVTKRRVLLDERGRMTEEGKRMADQIETIFHAKRQETVVKVLERYQIDYIIIFEEMIIEKVWTKEEEGLLFLLEYGKNFKKVFENSNVQIWKVSYNDKDT